MTADYMCPNCNTPWKCNGPHIPQAAGIQYDRELIADMLESYLRALATDAMDSAGQYLPDHVQEQMDLLRAADNAESKAVTTQLRAAAAEGGPSLPVEIHGTIYDVPRGVQIHIVNLREKVGAIQQTRRSHPVVELLYATEHCLSAAEEGVDYSVSRPMLDAMTTLGLMEKVGRGRWSPTALAETFVRTAHSAPVGPPPTDSGAGRDGGRTTGTVADISDDALLCRVVRGIARKRRKPIPAWDLIGNAFALGSTYSAQLCRRFGVDPDTGKPIPSTEPDTAIAGAAGDGD